MHDRGEANGQRAGEQVRVGVAGEQGGLEKHHGDRPDRRRPAEARQHHFREHRLHGEEEQRRDEEGGGEQRRRVRPGKRCHRIRCGGAGGRVGMGHGVFRWKNAPED
jgi:hypothetical protein